MTRRTTILGLLCLFLASCGTKQPVVTTGPTSATTASSKATTQPSGKPDSKTSNETQVSADLKKIALGIMDHYDTYMRLANNQFLPFGQKPDSVRPALLSWRVAILPHIGHDALYKQFKLDEPWDSPANKPLLAKMPAVYATGGDPATGKTVYRGFAAPGTVFEPGKNLEIRDFKDGTVNTILVIESNSPVEWTKPDDLTFEAIANLPDGGFQVVFADGTVRPINKQFSRDAFKKALTVGGREVYNLNDISTRTPAEQKAWNESPTPPTLPTTKLTLPATKPTMPTRLTPNTTQIAPKTTQIAREKTQITPKTTQKAP